MRLNINWSASWEQNECSEDNLKDKRDSYEEIFSVAPVDSSSDTECSSSTLSKNHWKDTMPCSITSRSTVSEPESEIRWTSHCSEIPNEECNGTDKQNTAFTYQDVLVVEKFIKRCPASETAEEKLHDNSAVKAVTARRDLNKIGNKQLNRNSISPTSCKLRYTRDHTNGANFAKLGGKRMDTTVIREAITQAVSQGKISTSTKRELRHQLLRGETNAVLEVLRRECHLKPVVAPLEEPMPSQYDIQYSDQMMKFLDLHAPVQDSDQLAKKHIILVELERIVDEWIKQLAQFKGRSEEPSSNLYIGGSWHLKVDTEVSDIDIVALVPVWVEKADFFGSLKNMLAAKPEVGDLISVNDATVPRMFFAFSGIDVDLLLSIFTQPSVPKHLPIHSDHILSGMDPGSVKSISGPRVASMILDLVPNPTSFRCCLRAVRLWAQRRGLYSNKVGFLGGISWSILVAFVNQLFPTATPSQLLKYFFTVLSHWNWPQPIVLSKPYDAGLGCVQWSPQRNLHDLVQVMPIITPGYPAVNSAYNVNASTLSVLQLEFTRGRMLMENSINIARCSPSFWNTLFEASNFFIQYSHYLCVDLTANNASDLRRWTSYIECRIRKLVETLANTPGVAIVHPYTNHIGCTSSLQDGSSFYVGFEIDSSHCIQDDIIASIVAYFLGTEVKQSIQREAGMDARIIHRRWHDLPDFLFSTGKQQAAGDRAKLVLSRAHLGHTMHFERYSAHVRMSPIPYM